MEKFHEHYDRNTPFEKKYLPLISQITDANERNALAQEISGKKLDVDKRGKLKEEMKPHSGFIEAYNERSQKEKKMEVRRKSQTLYNEDGKRFGKNWEYSSYQEVHDPLKIFEKKGNHEELAWKVFTEVDDSNVYLKALYYPRITSEDFHLLLDKFEIEYQSFQNKNRLSYAFATGSAIGSWALAYTFRFKPATFVFATGVAFISTKYALNKWFTSQMNDNLNAFGIKISNKYPEIKFSRVLYTKSSDIAPQKLL